MTKITEVKVIRTRATGMWAIVKVLTDQPGLYGIGSASDVYHPETVIKAVETIAPLLIGRDAGRSPRGASPRAQLRMAQSRMAQSNTCASIDHHSVLGDFCHAAPGVHTGGGVTIGCGALIGVGASILPGRCIGDWATVGAGAVVTGDVLGYATAVGVPAKVIAQKENG